MNILKKVKSFTTLYIKNADILETLYERTAYLLDENGKIKFQQKSDYERYLEYKKLSHHHFKKYFDGAFFLIIQIYKNNFQLTNLNLLRQKKPPLFLNLEFLMECRSIFFLILLKKFMDLTHFLV